MDAQDWLTERFEENRPRLCNMAYRMLGSRSEAEDAVQEAWLRLHRADMASVDNLSGWLTTVVARVCLDQLRARKARRAEVIDVGSAEPSVARGDGADPEGAAIVADSVGVALLVLLDSLTPAERLAFVLHDLFALPFDEIAVILGRSTAAVKQLASRARRRVRGAQVPDGARRTKQRRVVDAFLRAVRAGDLEGLLAVLDPDAVVRIDAAARIDAPAADVGKAREVRGASNWASYVVALAHQARFLEPALIDGSVGLIVVSQGQLIRAMRFTIVSDKVARIDVVGDPNQLRQLTIAAL